jgi:hypothetical protein
MARTPERAVKDKVKALLDSLKADVYYCMPIGTGYGNSGVPDFIGNYRGLFFAVEAKANGGKPTTLQQHHITRIEATGALSIVVDETNVNDLHNILLWWYAHAPVRRGAAA